MAVRQSTDQVPSWTDPIITLFESTMKPWGHHFDILYAPVWNSPHHPVSRRLPRWQHLGKYWHHVLYLWNTGLSKKLTRNMTLFDKLTTPFLDNVYITTATEKPKTLRGANLAMAKTLMELGVYRPTDLFERCGYPVRAAALSRYLHLHGANSKTTSERFCETFLGKIGSLLRPLPNLPPGPRLKPAYHCALHTWSFHGSEVADLTVSQIRKLLVEPKAPPLPTEPLGIEKSPSADIWGRDLKMNKHVLPVYADLLYRLQHNALWIGFRLQHAEDATTHCHHGCGVIETIPHLFWYCDFAVAVWQEWLDVFQQWFESRIEWETVVYFNGITPTAQAKKDFGYSLFVVLHMVRVIVLRCLWGHRNDIRFHEVEPNLIDVKTRVHALMDLHVAAFWQATQAQAIKQSSQVAKKLVALLSQIPVKMPYGAAQVSAPGDESATTPAQGECMPTADQVGHQAEA